MIKNLSLLAGLTTAAAGLSLAFSPSAQAIGYSLTATFSSGGSAAVINNASFDAFDFASGSYTGINIDVVGGGPINPNASFSDTDVIAQSATSLQLASGTFNTAGYRALTLNFTAPGLTGTSNESVPLLLSSTVTGWNKLSSL